MSVGILLALAACESTSIPMTPVVDAKVKSRASNQFNPSIAVIRSYREDENGRPVQFGGAVCSGSNARVSFSNVVTPAQIRMPTYLQADRFADRGRPPPIKVRCRVDGKTVNLTWNAENLVSNQSAPGATICNQGVCTTGSTTRLTSRLSSTLPWFYAPASLEF